MIDINDQTNYGLGIDSFEFATSPAHGAILAFVYLLLLGGGGYYSNPGALKAPPPAQQKKTAETKEFESKIDSFFKCVKTCFLRSY